MTMYLVGPPPEDPHEQNPDGQTIPDNSAHDPYAELAVLAAMMHDRDIIGDVCAIIKLRDLYKPVHQKIFSAIVRLFAAGKPTDPISVCDELGRSGDLAGAGGPAFVHHCADAMPVGAVAEYFAEIVHAKAVLRRLVESGMRIVDMGRKGEGDVAELVDAAQKELFEVADQQADEEIVLVADAMEGHLDEMQARADRENKLVGIPTGFADLDELTGGLRRGQMIVIAARPAMGKSTLAIDIVREVTIRQKLPMVIFSLEMQRGEILDRIISAEARVPLHHIRSGNMTDDDWTKVARVMPKITEAPMYIDSSSHLTGMDIRTKARRLSQKHKLGGIVIDYLQLMNSGGSKAENRQLEVSDISRGSKTLAKELDCPVIALSQLNRGPEQRTDKRPVVSDLRESGSIEQDADMVILIHREDAYEKESPRAGEADLIVGKNRNGPTPTITVAFQGHLSRFVDMTRDEPN
ncbi:replicative DNA helicase [Kitasatospora mediocidica]|uniref:replicative DNA helicase n=1 Tax=Kitasatospora mediocidica TaxID=58352 RepID=UPI00068B9ADB|nr:replicative DNA helicase [Kitasatospora mediocidica]